MKSNISTSGAESMPTSSGAAVGQVVEDAFGEGSDARTGNAMTTPAIRTASSHAWRERLMSDLAGKCAERRRQFKRIVPRYRQLGLRGRSPHLEAVRTTKPLR